MGRAGTIPSIRSAVPAGKSGSGIGSASSSLSLKQKQQISEHIQVESSCFEFN